MTVHATYFAGGPLPGAPVHWDVRANATSFTPPNRDDYVFGAEPPRDLRDPYGIDGFGVGDMLWKSWSLDGSTDATGAHVMHLEFLSVKPAMPMSVEAHATVTDVNRQSWLASSVLLVHPSSLYVGLKASRPFVDKGTPFEVDVIGVDLDGKAAVGASITVKAARLDWELSNGEYTTKERDEQTCKVVAAKASVPCSFQTPHGGEYRLTATIVDANRRTNQTQLRFWVSGGERPPSRGVTRESVRLIADKKAYTPGNTAEILVQAPFYPSEGVVSWRRSGIVKAEKIVLDGPTTVITVPISDAMVPNLSVHVDLVGMAARTDDQGAPDPKLPKRPAYAVGAIELSVPPRQRTLQVVVTPRAARLAPGATTQLAVEVSDAQGKPVADAEAAVIVVDEAIPALTGYEVPDPLDRFYVTRTPDARDAYSRAYVWLGTRDGDRPVPSGRMYWSGDASLRLGVAGFAVSRKPAVEASSRTLSGNAGVAPAAPRSGEKLVVEGLNSVDDGRRVSASIALRSNFNPLAAFAPTVHTDAAGKATVEVKLPDSLTRYRVVAIAVAGDKQFGKGESAVTARLPLTVRPSPPRFLNFGDRFRLPVVVQNQTDAAMTVRLAVRASNATLTDGAGREVSVPANDRVEVQFPAAAELAGTARFQVVGAAGAASDAAELALPVWTPATREAFATYGVIDDGAQGNVVRQPIALPGKVVAGFGGLEVTTASTNLGSLTDALLYLVGYPFECAEQRASRILAVAALNDVLAAFHSKDLPSPAAIATSVGADIERLAQMQSDDGGFAFWDRSHPSQPYLTVYVTSALGHAKNKGVAVPAMTLDRAKHYLRTIESHYPAFYPKDVRWAISAYALYTRKQLGDVDVAKARKLIAEAGVDKLSLEASGWLLGTLARNPAAADERKAIVQHALNRVSETAGAASSRPGTAMATTSCSRAIAGSTR